MPGTKVLVLNEPPITEPSEVDKVKDIIGVLCTEKIPIPVYCFKAIKPHGRIFGEGDDVMAIINYDCQCAPDTIVLCTKVESATQLNTVKWSEVNKKLIFEGVSSILVDMDAFGWMDQGTHERNCIHCSFSATDGLWIELELVAKFAMAQINDDEQNVSSSSSSI